MCRLQTTRGKGKTRTCTEPALYGSVVKVFEFAKLDRASRRSFEDRAARCPEHRLPLHTVGAFARRLSLPVARWRLRSVRFTGRKTWSPATPVAEVHSSVAASLRIADMPMVIDDEPRRRVSSDARQALTVALQKPPGRGTFNLWHCAIFSFRYCGVGPLGMSVAGTDSSQVRVYALAKV
jgi:hypothetical protein